MPHAYTEDQQAPRTLTQPLPVGEEIEQPAVGVFGEQSTLPNPQPGLPATFIPSPLPPGESGERSFRVGEGLGDGGERLDRNLTDT